MFVLVTMQKYMGLGDSLIDVFSLIKQGYSIYFKND